ncbi:MAG: chitobiase/beta-hexosaminidase C-terminal domain-containing protein [Bacteroidota bacterium]|nr:chitobiase/beta-hexosaminidase C-terminal domain-containing protein [Bacteroidota bacterium]
MSHRLVMIATLVAMVLLSTSVAFAQVDSFMINVRKNIEKVEREKALRTNDENKLQGSLYDLLRLSEEADTSLEKQERLSKLMKSNKYLAVDSQGRIRVIIELKSINDTTIVNTIVRALGGEIEKVGLVPYIRCKIHPKKLRNLISATTIRLIREQIPGHRRDIVSAGDAQLKADQVRAQYAAYGDGIKIGVLSDGVDNLANIPKPNELPYNVTVIPGNAGIDDEGTAMLEIVHDLAPNAELYFYSALGGYDDLADGITALKNSLCKVIVDDFGYFNEPFFTDEDELLGAAIRNFISGGGTYVSAGGNDNYDIENLKGYSIYSGVTNFISDVNTFASNLTYLEVEVPAFRYGMVFFQWAEQWVNPANDYDIYVYDETGNNDVGHSILRQGGGIPPREEVSFSNATSTDKVYRIVIKAPFSSSSGTDFKIISTRKLRNSFTNNRHVYGHPGYPDVIGVAAYDADYSNQMAKYSSWGPLRMYSTVASSWSDYETPLITGTAKVSTYVGSVLKQFDEPFEGTSAAAPHIAAIAGLYFSKYHSRTRDNFMNDLKYSGASIYSVGGTLLTGGGYHQQSGYGKADALACFQRAEMEVGGAPTFDPPSCTVGNAGCGTNSYVDVRLSTSVPGTEIWYTIDGFTNPTNNSANGSRKYDETPIRITSTTTIKAKAFKGDFQSPISSATYVFPGQSSITINSISPTVIQVGQSTVTTTISYTRQLKWPNAAYCRFANEINVYIDNTHCTACDPPKDNTSNSFQFSYAFGEGDHSIRLFQRELDQSCTCDLSQACPYPYTADVTAAFRVDKSIQVTLQNEFKDPDNTVRHGGFVNVDGADIDTDPTGGQYVTPLVNGSTHTFTANEQLYRGYYRGFNPRSDKNGGWIFPNPLTPPQYTSRLITQVEIGPYTARYRNQYDVSAAAARYIDPGSGGTYKVNGTNVGSTWSGNVWQYESITLEAVPPSGFIFIEWSDGVEQNPRTLILTDHKNLYAVFKKHLASSTSAALSPNSQRKLVAWHCTGCYSTISMAYESGGGTFGSHSFDLGATWVNEYTHGGIPSSTVQYRNPTLVINPDEGTVSRIYEKIEDINGNWLHTIKWDGAPYYFPTPIRLEDLSYFTAPRDYRAFPSTEMTKSHDTKPSILFASWLNNGSIDYGISVVYHYQPNFSWTTKTLSGVTISNPVNLSVAAVNNASLNQTSTQGTNSPAAPIHYNFYIIWEEEGTDGGIKYASGRLTFNEASSASDIVWAGPITIASNSITITNSKPTVTLDGEKYLIVAWEYRNSNQGNIKVQRRVESYLIGEFTFPNLSGSENYPSSPSLTDYRFTTNKNKDLTIIWTAPNYGIACALFNGTTTNWSDPFIIPSTSNYQVAVLNDNKSTNILERYVLALSISGPPYNLATIQVPSTPLPPTQPSLNIPVNGQNNFALNIPLQWKPSFRAASYRVQVSTTNSPFESGIFRDQSNITSTSYQPSGLNYSTTYYWRVCASNSNGTGNWSQAWSFSTSPTKIQYAVMSGWNLISVPLTVWNYQKSSIYPTANSDAFYYNGSYVPVDNLVICDAIR